MGLTASALTEISGQGEGLTCVAYGDEVATVEKMGTGNYRDRQSGEVHAYTVSFVVQLWQRYLSQDLGAAGCVAILRVRSARRLRQVIPNCHSMVYINLGSSTFDTATAGGGCDCHG